MEPKREHRPQDERRQQLIDAGVAVMSEEGVAAVTTRAVTARAGLPHGSFHYCFESKSDLFGALLEQELHRSLATVFAPPVERLAPVARLVAGLQARLDQVAERPSYFLALSELIALSQRDPALGDLARWEHGEALRAVTRNVEEWSAADALSWSAPTARIAALLISLADGITSSWLLDRDDAAAHDLIGLAATAVTSLLKEGTA